MRWNALGIAVLAALAAQARAGILTPTDQFRSVEASASVTEGETEVMDSQSLSAPGFGLFDEAVSALASLGDPNDAVAGRGAADQLSGFLPTMTFGNGTAAADTDLSPDGRAPNGFGLSVFSATIMLDADTPYDMTGSLEMSSAGGGSGIASVVFEGPGGVLIEEESLDGTVPFGASGLLVSGEYTIDIFVVAEANAAGAEAAGSFDFELTLIPEPGSAASLLLGAFWLRRARG